jgi:ATP-dependent helicase HepA
MTTGALVTVPELQAEGLARLISTRGGYSVIRFLASGAEMTQEASHVLRYALTPDTRVRFQRGEAELIGRISTRRILRDAASGLLIYGVRTEPDAPESPLREDAVTGLIPVEDPVEQLATVQFNDLRPAFAKAGSMLPPEPWGGQTAAAREELLAWRDAAWGLTQGVIGLAAARIEALPHQMLVAQRALADRQVRFLLADEVGLGKTIEAGLIIQSLLAIKPTLRVLVIVPGALLSQWFLELYVRFGGQQYLMLDGERLRSYEGNPWDGEQFVLASSRAVEELDGKGALRLATSKWDVVVVDECHRMQPGGVLYKRVAVLSKGTPHVLLLSATPARQHPDAYLALLSLLQPQVWKLDDLAGFTSRLAAFDQVVELLGRTLTAPAAELATLANAWAALVPGDTLLATRAAKLAAAPGDATARTDLIGYVREHLQLDRRVIRNRRQVLARLAAASGVRAFAPTTRSRETVTYSPDTVEAAVRAAVTTYRTTLVKAFAGSGKKAVEIPPRLAHWLTQVELALAAHPVVLERMLAMRATVLADPDNFVEYRARARTDETLAQVLRSDLSENEINSHIAISAACHCLPERESAVLAALRSATTAWHAASAKKPTARLRALQARLEQFWADSPQEKVLIFTTHNLAVEPLAEALRKAFGDGCIETFGAHQDTAEREEAARRFQVDDRCAVLICDPLGGEGRNFQFVSVVVHHDLPWSLAAVEQRIGRVDRLGRDGDIPSWILAPDTTDAIDAAWGELLDSAVNVFGASSSGLEFVADAVETLALRAALTGGGAGVRAAISEAVALVAAERTTRETQADDAFATDAAAYAAAGTASAAVAQAIAPAGAVARWIRGMGGEARREEEHPKPWRLRTRYHDEPQHGVYDRAAALSHPQHGFFGIGHRLIDRLIDDATSARWCRATAWRRPKPTGVAAWNGLRAIYALTPDYAPIMAAGLRLEVLRRLFMSAPPKRLTICVGCDDGQVVTDPALVTLLATPFSAKAGDAALSTTTNREVWTRPLLAGQPEKVTSWQAGVRKAATAAEAHVATLLATERQALRGALDERLSLGLAAAQATAAATALRLGTAHAEARQAATEAAEEERQVNALRAAVDGAQFSLELVAFVAVA